MACPAAAVVTAVGRRRGASARTRSTGGHVIGHDGRSLFDAKGVDVERQVTGRHNATARGDAAEKFQRVVGVSTRKVRGAENRARVGARLRRPRGGGHQLNGVAVVDGVVQRAVQGARRNRKRVAMGDLLSFKREREGSIGHRVAVNDGHGRIDV